MKISFAAFSVKQNKFLATKLFPDGSVSNVADARRLFVLKEVSKNWTPSHSQRLREYYRQTIKNGGSINPSSQTP